MSLTLQMSKEIFVNPFISTSPLFSHFSLSPPSPPRSRSKRHPNARHRQLYYRPARLGWWHSPGPHSVHRRYTLCARRMGWRGAGRAQRQEWWMCVGQALLPVRAEARHLLAADTLNSRAVEWRWHLQPFDDHIAEPFGYSVAGAVLLFDVPEPNDGVHAPQELFK